MDSNRDLSFYENLYKDLHQHPELSLQEKQTADKIAQHLRSFEGISVHTGIGGHGVVGVLGNGTGKTVLLRADTDALPVEEKTGLEYASKVKMVDVEDGVEKNVMHACGHDMHIACLLAATETLHKTRDTWQGTLIALFQPCEERGAGARAMVDDGLYEKIPVPDVVLGQHVMPFKAGTFGTRGGFMATASDNLRVTLYGRGGHASQPHRAIDPVRMAASVVVRLQSIVSREVPPPETTVVTVASIQAGMTENVIPDEAVLKINVRTVNPATRERVLASIRKIITSECEASNAPREPSIQPTSSFPLTVNDGAVTEALERSFAAKFSKDCYSADIQPLGGSEDFPILATSKGVPYCYWTFGGTDPKLCEEAERKGTVAEDIPFNHSPFFAPVIQPTLSTGTDALITGALTFLSKTSS
ncbi:MAG: hypothetical protein M1816_002845 [Peltula sp. TS41687]|nr:MAG: hypothetical protein M1816_002845 [Peltula sp. TS41687]